MGGGGGGGKVGVGGQKIGVWDMQVWTNRQGVT